MEAPLIYFGSDPGQLSELADEAFLQSVRWNRRVPDAVRRAAKRGDIEAFCRAMKKHHATATKRASGTSAGDVSAAELQADWSRQAFDQTEASTKLCELWDSIETSQKSTATKAQKSKSRSKSKHHPGKNGNGRAALQRKSQAIDPDMLAAIVDSHASGNEFSPFELLVLLEILLRRGDRLPEEVYWRIWRAALTRAIGLAADVENSPGCRTAVDTRLVVEGELCWECGLMFASIRGASQLRQAGSRVINRQILDHSDTDGTPEADLLERLPLWLAPLTRSAAWSRAFREPLFDNESAERFQLLTKVVAPLCRADGKLALGNGHSTQVVSLLTEATGLAGWKSKSLPRVYLRSVRHVAGKKRKKRQHADAATAKSTKRKKRPVTQSDWASLACLRNNWSLQADTLVIAYQNAKPSLDLSVLGAPLLGGEWDVEVRVDGKPQPIADEWSCTCWYSDRDCDYLELHNTTAGSVEIDRHVLLSRHDHFLILADSISGAGRGRVVYRSRLPLAGGTTGDMDRATREAMLTAEGVTSRVFPLGLASERVVNAAGGLTIGDATLELEQSAIGGMLAPIVLDWAPERTEKIADWNSLTVSEDGKVLGSDVAAGHRLRVGKQQLLFYRSLQKSDLPRAVLGHHTSHEMVIGRFSSEGEVDPILLVE